MWILIGIASVLVLAGALVARLGHRGTIYILRKNGYTSFSQVRSSHHHHTPQEGLQKVIDRLLPANFFDMLWVSTRDDEYSGVILTVDSGTPVLSVTFKTHAEHEKLAAFKRAMTAGGFSGSEESNGFNGGTGEEFRITSLEYRLTPASDKVLEAVECALANLYPGDRDGYFVEGSNLREIVGSRPGVKFVPDSDPLRDLH
ncbi:MAG TPA: hypothetical protein VKT78_07730 [Fimbriimonadaceae bacterium]|nr:hypothetical protein [Fimbriimonadaceae bacterium]